MIGFWFIPLTKVSGKQMTEIFTIFPEKAEDNITTDNTDIFYIWYVWYFIC